MTGREVERQYWAVLLKSKVEKDGQVPGFSEWWGKANPKLAKAVLRIGRATVDHVKRGAPADEAIGLAVAEARQTIQYFTDSESPSTDRWTAFCSEILTMVREHGWKPPQVLEALETSRQAMLSEGPVDLWIDELRSFGPVWPVQRLERSWAMPDGSTVEFRFPS